MVISKDKVSRDKINETRDIQENKVIEDIENFFQINKCKYFYCEAC